MAQHATEKYANVIATLNAEFSALVIAGSPVLVEIRQRRDVPSGSTWVRLSIAPLDGVDLGHLDAATRLSEESVLVIADVFHPETSLLRYYVDEVADALRDWLEGFSVPLKDYSVDPDSPVALADYVLRVIGRPSTLPVPSSEGYARSRVQARARWVAAHTI